MLKGNEPEPFGIMKNSLNTVLHMVLRLVKIATEIPENEAEQRCHEHCTGDVV